MPFTVLSDADVQRILGDLSEPELNGISDALEQALVRYSTGDEQQFQPHRAVTTRPGGQVTLFMPATTEDSVAVKIVGVRPSQAAPEQRRDQNQQSSAPALQSVLTVCDAQSRAVGVLNAAELTAFRTALGSILFYRRRVNTGRILVFGAGKQALWHVRLAVLVRGSDIRSIHVVNRSKQRAEELIATLSGQKSWPSHISMTASDSQEASGAALEELVAAADVIFCTTPSTSPLFPAASLTSDRAREKTRFVSAIGSYRRDMAEIDPELLKLVASPDGPFSSEVWKGKITVDTRAGCLQEAGELITAGIRPENMLEIGQIPAGEAAVEDATGLRNWLASGFVIYKSVGVGIMDIAVGQYMLELARSKGIGYTLDSF